KIDYLPCRSRSWSFVVKTDPEKRSCPMKTSLIRLAALIALATSIACSRENRAGATRAYASINGLSMYYEIHGTGAPLVLLHGGSSTTETSLAGVIPTLSKTRRVIAIEQQGHGHTADIDRPLTYEQMAEDTNALLEKLGVVCADFFGWSDGGSVALRVAMRHP